MGITERAAQNGEKAMSKRTIANRLARLEERCGNDGLPGPLAQWVENLENWPDEWIHRPKWGRSKDREVTAERAAEVKALCREVAAKLRDGTAKACEYVDNEAWMIFALLEELPDEAVCGLSKWNEEQRDAELDETVRALVQFLDDVPSELIVVSGDDHESRARSVRSECSGIASGVRHADCPEEVEALVEHIEDRFAFEPPGAVEAILKEVWRIAGVEGPLRQQVVVRVPTDPSKN